MYKQFVVIGQLLVKCLSVYEMGVILSCTEDVQDVRHPENSPSGLCFRQQDLCPGMRSQ